MAKTKLVKKKILKYTAIFEPAEEGGYIVTVPAIPGCVTQGENLKDAKKMAKDAIRLCLETMRDLNEEIPKEPKKIIISKIPVTVRV